VILSRFGSFVDEEKEKGPADNRHYSSADPGEEQHIRHECIDRTLRKHMEAEMSDPVGEGELAVRDRVDRCTPQRLGPLLGS
jgi:hypothetical protein